MTSGSYLSTTTIYTPPRKPTISARSHRSEPVRLSRAKLEPMRCPIFWTHGNPTWSAHRRRAGDRIVTSNADDIRPLVAASQRSILVVSC